jgi:hypothetical protein
MDTEEFIVIITGLGSIALTLWYFFGEREKTSRATKE